MTGLTARRQAISKWAARRTLINHDPTTSPSSKAPCGPKDQPQTSRPSEQGLAPEDPACPSSLAAQVSSREEKTICLGHTLSQPQAFPHHFCLCPEHPFLAPPEHTALCLPIYPALCFRVTSSRASPLGFHHTQHLPRRAFITPRGHDSLLARSRQQDPGFSQ